MLPRDKGTQLGLHPKVFGHTKLYLVPRPLLSDPEARFRHAGLAGRDCPAYPAGRETHIPRDKVMCSSSRAFPQGEVRLASHQGKAVAYSVVEGCQGSFPSVMGICLTSVLLAGCPTLQPS